MNKKQYRSPKTGRYARLSKRGGYLFLLGIAVYLCAGYMVTASSPVSITNPIPQVVEKVIDNSDKKYQEKIDELKQEVLNTLSLGCEVKGVEDPDGALVFDKNEKASVGRFQFQINTVKHYYKVLYEQDITNSEAIAIAIDPDRATQLAKDIIFTTDAGVDSDWVNCSKWHNLQREVDIIKKLEN